MADIAKPPKGKRNVKSLVFVYGSLKKGLHNNVVLGDSNLIHHGHTADKYLLRSLGSFPGVDITAENATSYIYGEVYSCDPDTLRRLDNLEGYPTFYDKIEVDVVVGNGATTITATMYHLANPKEHKGTTISSGIWKEEAYLTDFFSNRSQKWTKSSIPERNRLK